MTHLSEQSFAMLAIYLCFLVQCLNLVVEAVRMRRHPRSKCTVNGCRVAARKQIMPQIGQRSSVSTPRPWKSLPIDFNLTVLRKPIIKPRLVWTSLSAASAVSMSHGLAPHCLKNLSLCFQLRKTSSCSTSAGIALIRQLHGKMRPFCCLKSWSVLFMFSVEDNQPFSDSRIGPVSALTDSALRLASNSF